MSTLLYVVLRPSDLHDHVAREITTSLNGLMIGLWLTVPEILAFKIWAAIRDFSSLDFRSRAKSSIAIVDQSR